MATIKKFNEQKIFTDRIDTIGELREFIKNLPDEMGIISRVDGGGASDYSFTAYAEDRDFPGEKLFEINVSY